MYIVYDAKLKRPGCVLLQAALGGTVSQENFLKTFPTESWLLAPTDDMRTYPVTDEQLAKLGVMAQNRDYKAESKK